MGADDGWRVTGSLGAAFSPDGGAMATDLAIRAPSQVPAPAQCVAHLCRWWCGYVEATRPHVVIAFVPDRTDPALEYQSRGAVTAVRLAAEQLGYAHTSDETVDGCEDTIPAPITFERVGRAPTATETVVKPDDLAVILVSEVPDAEPASVPLKFALRLAAIRSKAERFEIVGPTFSGTAAPLARALRRASIDVRSLEIFASAATSPRLEELFGGYRVHRLTANDAELTNTLYAYLENTQGVRPDDDGILVGVGILRETGTGWSALADRRAHCTVESPCPQVELTFPYRITELRRRWEDEQAAEIDVLRSGAAVGGRVPPRADHRDGDGPDIVEGLDGALRRLLAEVAEARVRYVGIEATYAWDALYLTHQLHLLAPDARVFLMSNDVAFTTDEAASLVGTYVVTSYPYLGTDDFWVSDPQRRQMTFVSDAAEATYNATLFAIARFDPAAAGCDHGLARPAELAFCATGTSDGLPVWLGVIGADGFEPISHRVTHPDDSRSTHDPSCEIRLDREVVPPNLWLVLVLVLGVGLELDRRRVLRRARQVDSNVPGMRAQQAFLGVASRVIWYGAACWLVIVHVTAALRVFEPGDVWSIVVLYGPLVLAALPRLVAPHLGPEIAGERGSAFLQSIACARKEWRLARTTALLVGIVVMLWILNCGVVLPPVLAMLHETPALFALRTLSLGNLVSPAVPLLCIAAATWALIRGRSAILFDLARAGLPPVQTLLGSVFESSADAPTNPRSGLPTTAMEIGVAEAKLRTLWSPSGTRLFRFGVMIGAAVSPPVLLAWIIKHPSTVEHRVVGWITALNALVAIVLVIGFLLELHELRERLEALLQALLRHAAAVFLPDIPLVLARTVDATLSRKDLDAGTNLVSKLMRLHASVVSKLATGVDPTDLGKRIAALAGWLQQNVTSDPSVKTPKVGAPVALRFAILTAKTSDGSGDRSDVAAVATKAKEAKDRENEARVIGSIVASAVAIIVTQYVRLVRHHVVHLTAAGLLLIAAISFYPFQPRGFFLLWAWLVVGAIAATSLSVFVELDRDVILSRIGRTVPGRFKVDSAFALRVLTYAVVPVLSLLASQHPEVARWIFSAFEPFLRVLR